MSSVDFASSTLLWLRGSRTPVVMVERMADTSVVRGCVAGVRPVRATPRSAWRNRRRRPGQAAFRPGTAGFSDLSSTRAPSIAREDRAPRPLGRFEGALDPGLGTRERFAADEHLAAGNRPDDLADDLVRHVAGPPERPAGLVWIGAPQAERGPRRARPV